MADEPEPPVPEILWKYLKWDDERLDEHYAFNMIVHSELYFAPKDKLNDPLDFHWREMYPTDRIERFNFAKEFCTKFVACRTDIHRVYVLTDLIRQMIEFTDGSADGVIATPVKFSEGVLCLSEVNNDFLMWSHYASGHRGICVGIRPDELDTFFRKCRYSEDPPIFDARNYLKNARELFVELSTYKAKRWEYEREWRSVSLVGPRRFPGCIERIVLGGSIDAETEAKVFDAVRQSGRPIKLFRARKHPTLYSLEIGRIELPPISRNESDLAFAVH